MTLHPFLALRFGIHCFHGILIAQERDFYEVRTHRAHTWRLLADNFENLLVLVFQIWCVSLPRL